MRRFLLPRLRDFIFVVVFVSALALGARMLNTDSDLGRHLALGRYMLETGRIPTQDLLSFTRAGEPRPPYEWLAQVFLALSYRALRLDGVVILASLAIAATFAVVFVDCNGRGNTPIVALLLTAWAAAASSIHWLARPHVFSFLLFAIWLRGLERLRKGESVPVWGFPVLMLIWANTHGGFVFGFLACAAYLAGWWADGLRNQRDPQVGLRLFLAGTTSLLASIITPDLWGNWAAVLSNRSSYVLSRTVETMPVQLSSPAVWPFLGLLTMAALLMVFFKRPAAAHVLLLLPLALLGLAMARNIPFFAIAAAPICVTLLAEPLGKVVRWSLIEQAFTEIDVRLGGYLWPAILVLLAIGFSVQHLQRTGRTIYAFNPAVLPVAAADWLDVHPMQGNMFNDFNWGGYLLFRIWPAQRVFIDSQSDFYGEPFIRQYADIIAGSPGWDSALQRYAVKWLLIPSHSGLAAAARQDPGWRVAYDDNLALIMVQK